MQGYNDGLTTLPLADYEPRLSPEAAQAADFDDYELETVTKQIFEEGLGLAGVSLLKQGVQGLVSSCPHRIRQVCTVDRSLDEQGRKEGRLQCSSRLGLIRWTIDIVIRPVHLA